MNHQNIDMVTLDEARQQTGVQRETIMAWTRKGTVRSQRIVDEWGESWRVSVGDVQRAVSR